MHRNLLAIHHRLGIGIIAEEKGVEDRCAESIYWTQRRHRQRITDIAPVDVSGGKAEGGDEAVSEGYVIGAIGQPAGEEGEGRQSGDPGELAGNAVRGGEDRVLKSAMARFWTQRSSLRLPQRGITIRNAIPGCIRPEKAISGILA
jgi:hypothetical protein